MVKEREVNLYRDAETGRWLAEGEGLSTQAESLEQLLDSLKTLIPQQPALETVTGPVQRDKLQTLPSSGKRPLGLPKGKRIVPKGGLVSDEVSRQREERHQGLVSRKQ